MVRGAQIAVDVAGVQGRVVALPCPDLVGPVLRAVGLAPGGRPGGYPVRASAGGLGLDLPDGTSEADAIAVNATAARWDGVEEIAEDGTVTFTREAADAGERLLGLRVESFTVGEIDALAAEMEQRKAALTRPAGG